MKSTSLIGRFLYGAAFIVVLPSLLVLWAHLTRNAVPLTRVEDEWTGLAILATGVALMASGMLALIRWGKGLPMNAYPPPVYVAKGIFRYLGNPIYVGFVLVCLGISVATGSRSGLWLVTPITALAAAALVLGYERKDLRKRFGDQVRRPLVSLPPASDARPTRWDRISIFAIVFLPWTIAFEAVYRLGIPIDAIEAYLPFEYGLPVLQWTEPIYASVYLFVGLVPLFIGTQRELRRFAQAGLVATVVITLIYLTVPVVAPPRPFEPRGLLGWMLMGERAMSHTVAAFPSFHVVWTLIAADVWTRRFPRMGLLAWTWAMLISLSCITTGMHAVADVAFAFVIFIPIRAYARVWEIVRRSGEAIANSWKEWRLGPVRILNYGAYAGVGAGIALVVAETAAGPEYLWVVAAICFLSLLGAGLWAQKLEGSSGLSRPFGYFGGLLVGTVCCVAAGALGYSPMVLLASVALAGPFVQAIGRLRCLVQGCCHGSPAPEHVGIRYGKPRSRVLEHAKLGGVPLHPTPIYSILSLIVIGALLVRLCVLGASPGMIAGLYLILNGLARFVEESYRGEPQTMLVSGLRLYQWLGFASMILGVVLTCIPGGNLASPAWPGATVVVVAIVYGLVVGAAMGVDFPGSDKRYARLASV